VSESPDGNNNIVPFGKYKGQPVDVLRQDPGYVEWMLGQDWFRERYHPLYQVIINNFGEPGETPEHNALQARFLDEGLCRGLLAVLGWQPVADGVGFVRIKRDENLSQELARLERSATKLEQPKGGDEDYERKYFPQTQAARLVELTETRETIVKLSAELASSSTVLPFLHVHSGFEVHGWDVRINAKAWLTKPADVQHRNDATTTVWIELKPALGDDYPAVLRQMKANSRQGNEWLSGYKVLVFDRFTAVGATIDQVKAIFNASEFTVLSIAEVCAASIETQRASSDLG
jgi:hypothetical protein